MNKSLKVREDQWRQKETEKEESTQNKKKKAKDGPHFQMRKRESVFGTEKVAQMKAGGMSVPHSSCFPLFLP